MTFYPFTLPQVLAVWGVLYLWLSVCGFLRMDSFIVWLKGLHRNTKCGYVFFGTCVFWTVLLIMTIDLMEYSHMRGLFTIVVMIVAGLVVRYMSDYLAVRSIGILLLYAAKIPLDAAFMRDEPLKLIVPTLAYLHIIVGMFLIGMPYLFRDGMAWLESRPKLRRCLLGLGVALGVGLLGLAAYFSQVG